MCLQRHSAFVLAKSNLSKSMKLTFVLFIISQVLLNASQILFIHHCIRVESDHCTPASLATKATRQLLAGRHHLSLPHKIKMTTIKLNYIMTVVWPATSLVKVQLGLECHSCDIGTDRSASDNLCNFLKRQSDDIIFKINLISLYGFWVRPFRMGSNTGFQTWWCDDQ